MSVGAGQPQRHLVPAPDEQVDILDARDFEPPEPFVQTLTRLQSLAVGRQLEVWLPREPYPLYEWLNQGGVPFAVFKGPEGLVKVRIGTSDLQPVAPTAPGVAAAADSGQE